MALNSVLGQVLDSIDHARYLGVDISSDLNFSHHVNRITANASKSLGFLKRNIKTKHPGIREAAYKATVRPQVEYASSVWSPYTKKDINKVEMVQRRIRVVSAVGRFGWVVSAWVVLAKFLGGSIRPILVGRFGRESFRPWVVSAQ